MALPTPEVPPPSQEWVSRRLRLPNDAYWQSLIDGLISKLLDEWYFYQTDGITPLETVTVWGEIWREYGESDVYQLGTFVPYITENAPPFTIPCDGSTFNRVDYPALYAILDPFFILDADTFFTPNMAGVAPIGAGLALSGTEFDVGVLVGSETHALTADENGTHSHTDAGHNHTYSPPGITTPVVAPGEVPVAAINIIPGVTGTGFANIQNSGLGTPHNNMQPSRAFKWGVYAR